MQLCETMWRSIYNILPMRRRHLQVPTVRVPAALPAHDHVGGGTAPWLPCPLVTTAPTVRVPAALPAQPDSSPFEATFPVL